MAAEKIGGTSSGKRTEEEIHQANVEEFSKTSTVGETFEITASPNSNEITTKMGHLKDKFGTNQSRTLPTGYAKSINRIDKINTNLDAVRNIMESSKFNEGGKPKDTLSK